MSQAPSKSLSVLRAAASQVASEELEIGLDGMIRAADEIANERGLPSPLRHSPHHSYDFGNDASHRGSGKEGAGQSTSPRGQISTVIQSIREAEADAQALANAMNLPTKISATVGFSDDVNAIIEHSNNLAAEGRTSDLRPPKAATDSWARQRYKKRLANAASRSQQASVASSKSMSLTSEPADVAMRLSLADDMPYGERIRQSFRTEVEEMLFRSTYSIQRSSYRSLSAASSSGSKAGKYLHMRKSADRLAAPVQREPKPWEKHRDKTLQYSLYEDAKECTFRPQTRGKRGDRAGDDDDSKEDPKFSFISRQEAEERHRREELAFSIGKRDYDALVDKKQCPKCFVKQSYDEVREKRKICPNCRVEYRKPLTWATVQQRFWKKCADYSKRVGLHRQELMQEIEDEYRTIVKKIVDESGKLVEVRVPRSYVLTAEQEQEFFDRIEMKLQLREDRLQAIAKEMYDDQCTFKPVVKQYKDPRRGPEDDDGADTVYSDDDKNIVQAFLARYEEDMDYRRDKMPQKYLPIRRRDEPHPEEKPFKV